MKVLKCQRKKGYQHSISCQRYEHEAVTIPLLIENYHNVSNDFSLERERLLKLHIGKISSLSFTCLVVSYQQNILNNDFYSNISQL